jgi:thiol-disulfide isomerase/thioredoxin
MKIFFGLLIVIMFLSQNLFAMGDLRMMQTSSVGKVASDFVLNKTDGTKSTLNEARGGKKAIVFFWATWCPHCRSGVQVLAGRVEELKSKNIEIVLVDIGENKSNVVAYLTSKKLSLVSFMDTEEEVANQYHVQGIPTLYFIGEDGIIKSERHDLPENVEAEFLVK